MIRMRLYIKDDLTDVHERTDKALGQGKPFGVELVAKALPKGYVEYVVDCPPAFAASLAESLDNEEGIYVNEVPPEIKAILQSGKSPYEY